MTAHDRAPGWGQVRCDAYLNDDFRVVSGVCIDEPLPASGDPVPGDVYALRKRAEPVELELRPRLGLAGDQAIAGDATGRLTFLENGGRRVDVLLFSPERRRGRSKRAARPSFLPLAPIVPGRSYTLVASGPAAELPATAGYGSPCFTRGTMIRMADGRESPIERIREGDLVMTLDNGAQPVRWIGTRSVAAQGHLAPIIFTPGAIGNSRELIVSPEHRILLSDWRAEMMVGTGEVLVRAADLVNGDTVYARPGGVVDYVHMLFDRHEIVHAEGAPCESLHLHLDVLAGLSAAARAEVLELFPELATAPHSAPQASRLSLTRHEARAILAQGRSGA